MSSSLLMDTVTVSPTAYTLFSLWGLPITNAFVTSVGVSLLIALGIRGAMGKPSIRPSRVQATIEIAFEGLQKMLEPIIGRPLMRHAFPFLLCLFFFILIQNWCGLIPGVGTIGMVETHEGETHLNYFLRPSNTDLTNTLALALVSFGAWIWYVVKYAGIGEFLHETFGNKADKKATPPALFYPMSLIFLLVGCIEVISILIRPVSLSFRLYGNMFGGESLLMGVTGMAGFLIPVPVYLLELLIGLVQAFVFMLLTAVYIGLACNHEEKH